MSPREQTLRLVILDRARLLLAREGIAVRPLSYREIEDACGVSRTTACNIETAALAKLRRHLREIESAPTAVNPEPKTA